MAADASQRKALRYQQTVVSPCLSPALSLFPSPFLLLFLLSGYSLVCCELLFFCRLKSYELKDVAQSLHDVYICTDWVTALSAGLQNSRESATEVSHFPPVIFSLFYSISQLCIYIYAPEEVCTTTLFIWISLQCNFFKTKSPVRTLT